MRTLGKMELMRSLKRGEKFENKRQGMKPLMDAEKAKRVYKDRKIQRHMSVVSLQTRFSYVCFPFSYFIIYLAYNYYFLLEYMYVAAYYNFQIKTKLFSISFVY